MKQKSEYTFKYNSNLGRHGWLRLTPAYSVKLVEEILGEQTLFNTFTVDEGIIFDPFCGTATTGIVAAEKGMKSYLYEINPFLQWFATVKSVNYDSEQVSTLYNEIKFSLTNGKFENFNLIWIPPMKNIERWWDDSVIQYLGKLHEFLNDSYGPPSLSKSTTNLLWIAFARLVIECSAADYGHISVSFKEERIEYDKDNFIALFLSIFEKICASTTRVLNSPVSIICGDSRDVQLPEKVNYVITSPPYPNRISYIRELRPYMYWLGFLNSGEEAGELDWKAIGGTWGSATSKLSSWESTTLWYIPQSLKDSVAAICDSDSKNGRTMAQYVLKFFYDMFVHLKNLRKNLANGCELYYILGNSSFYGNMVHTDTIIREMMMELKYENVDSKIIRKRNSKKDLYEFLISAKWNSAKSNI